MNPVDLNIAPVQIILMTEKVDDEIEVNVLGAQAHF